MRGLWQLLLESVGCGSCTQLGLSICWLVWRLAAWPSMSLFPGSGDLGGSSHTIIVGLLLAPPLCMCCTVSQPALPLAAMAHTMVICLGGSCAAAEASPHALADR